MTEDYNEALYILLFCQAIWGLKFRIKGLHLVRHMPQQSYFYFEAQLLTHRDRYKHIGAVPARLRQHSILGFQ